ncbi:MAG: hypothetical protein AB7L91_16395 [Dehalococcoidia bacterium]
MLPLLAGLTNAAMERVQQLMPPADTAVMPDELLLPNGERLRPTGSARFATSGQLAAERSLLRLRSSGGAPVRRHRGGRRRRPVR